MRVKQILSSEADGIVRRQTRLLRRLRDRRAGVVVALDPRGVEGDACHLRLARRERYRLVQSHELRKRRDRVPGAAFDLRRARRVAEDEEMRRRAVDEPERHARVHRVDERALPLDEEQLAAAPLALDDEPLGGAGEEVGDDRVDGDAPACDRDPRLSGRHEDGREPAPARLEVELDRDRLLPDRAVRADREDDRSRRTSRFAPVGTLSPCGGLRRSRSSTPCARASSVSSGSSETNSCRPLSTSRPAAMHAFRSSRHAGGKRPPWVATPTTATVGSYGSASSTDPDDRDALVTLSRPLRVEDRHHRIGPVADDPAHRLAVVRVVREALAEDEDAPRPAHAD